MRFSTDRRNRHRRVQVGSPTPSALIILKAIDKRADRRYQSARRPARRPPALHRVHGARAGLFAWQADAATGDGRRDDCGRVRRALVEVRSG